MIETADSLYIYVLKLLIGCDSVEYLPARLACSAVTKLRTGLSKEAIATAFAKQHSELDAWERGMVALAVLPGCISTCRPACLEAALEALSAMRDLLNSSSTNPAYWAEQQLSTVEHPLQLLPR